MKLTIISKESLKSNEKIFKNKELEKINKIFKNSKNSKISKISYMKNSLTKNEFLIENQNFCPNEIFSPYKNDSSFISEKKDKELQKKNSSLTSEKICKNSKKSFSQNLSFNNKNKNLLTEILNKNFEKNSKKFLEEKKKK